MVNAGFKLVMGSWKIMPMVLPRMSDILRSGTFKISSPSSSRVLALRIAFDGNKSMIASEVSDLPHPDSPTMHKVSPLST
jgi:hypothetical protein